MWSSSVGVTMLFIDEFGRYHQKPVTEDKPFPGNNAFLFSGYARVAGLYDKDHLNLIKVWDCWDKCQTKYGYNRHPNKDPFPACSHDEIVGMFLLTGSLGCKLLEDKLSKQRYQVCNLDGFEPKSWLKLNPFKVIRDFWRLWREDKPRTSTYKYPYIWPICFGHAPEHIYFYKRAAGVDPGVYLTLRFVLASTFTVYFGGVSGRTMLGFKLQKLESMVGFNEEEQEVYNLFHNFVDFKQTVREYFSPYTDHPITEALQGLTFN